MGGEEEGGKGRRERGECEGKGELEGSRGWEKGERSKGGRGEGRERE